MATYTKEEQFELIGESIFNLDIIDNQYEEVCLEAVKQSGLALKYVKEQTSEICLKAVKENGLAIRYIKEPTEEMFSIKSLIYLYLKKEKILYNMFFHPSAK